MAEIREESLPEMINFLPGDVVVVEPGNIRGVIQWINWDRSEVSVYLGENAFIVTDLGEVKGLVKRVFKPVEEMSPEEMKAELELLRMSRHLAIQESRQRRERRKSEVKTKKPASPPPDPLAFLPPEARALIERKVREAKSDEEV